MIEVDTWQKVGRHFRCGCCRRMPTCVDILDLKVCPHCQHVMKWYETDHGIFSMRPTEGEDQNGKEKEHEEPLSGEDR